MARELFERKVLNGLPAAFRTIGSAYEALGWRSPVSLQQPRGPWPARVARKVVRLKLPCHLFAAPLAGSVVRGCCRMVA